MTAPVFMMLPPREQFSPHDAGAISVVVHCWRCDAGGGRPGPCGGRGRFADVALRAVAPSAGSQLGYIWALRAVETCAGSVDVHQHPRLALTLARLFPGSKISLFLHNDPLTMRGLEDAFGRQRGAVLCLHRVVCVSEFLAARYRTGLSGPARRCCPIRSERRELPPRATAAA